jgi:hypothetical protein
VNIGFDLDNIFINTPPIVPGEIIEWLYKEKSNGYLRYRIPSKLEQIIRIISHHPLFRPPIHANLNYLRSLGKTKKDKYYLVSSRFSFLENRTNDLIKQHQLDKIFTAMYFNYSNDQPHEFKNKMIKKLNLDIFVDDDLQLLGYLADKNPKTKFFWLNKKLSKNLRKNLSAVKQISEILNCYVFI